MRMHPRKEAGIVVDFVPKAATHNERVVSLHSLLDADFYREGARVTPAPRRRIQRRARRKLTPAPWLVPVTPDVAPARGDPARVAARRPEVPRRGRAALLGHDRRPADALRRARCVRREAHRARRVEGRLETFLADVRRAEPEPAAAPDRARRPRVDARRARGLRRPRHARDAGAAVGEGPRGGVRILLRAIAEGKADAPDQILARWTWRLARASRKTLDRERAQSTRRQAPARRARELARPPARGERGEARQRRARAAARVGAALLASAEGYTPRATQLIEAARERLGTIQEVAGALAENLPAAEATSGRSRRRKRRKRRERPGAAAAESDGRGKRPPGDAQPPPSRQPAETPARVSSDYRAMLVLVPIAFAAGVVTAFSPCVLPVLPILLAGGARAQPPYASWPGSSRASRLPARARGCGACSGSARAPDPDRAVLLFCSRSRCSSRGSRAGSSGRSRPDPLPRRRLGGGSCSVPRLGLVFVPCGGPVLAAVTSSRRATTSAAGSSSSRSRTRSAPRCRCSRSPSAAAGSRGCRGTRAGGRVAGES